MPYSQTLFDIDRDAHVATITLKRHPARTCAQNITGGAAWNRISSRRGMTRCIAAPARARLCANYGPPVAARALHRDVRATSAGQPVGEGQQIRRHCAERPYLFGPLTVLSRREQISDDDLLVHLKPTTPPMYDLHNPSVRCTHREDAFSTEIALRATERFRTQQWCCHDMPEPIRQAEVLRRSTMALQRYHPEGLPVQTWNPIRREYVIVGREGAITAGHARPA